MSKNFQVGDHVCWNSEAGHVSGRIIKIHTRDTEYKGHPRHASKDEPQFEIQSDKTDHIAMHKGAALHKMTKERAFDRLATGLQNNTKMESMVWTKGHSTRPLKRFLALLAHYQVESVADVWRFPGSRRQPQWVQAPLRNALAEHGIAYDWIAALGGRRRPRPDSPNIVWRNASFAAMPTISPAGVGPGA